MRLCLIGNPNIAHVRRWVKDFASLGYDVFLIGEHKILNQPPEGCKFFNLPQRFNTRKLRYIVWGLLTRTIIKQTQPDILQCLGIASAGWLGVASGFNPFLASALGSDLMLLEQRNPVHQKLSRWVLKRADYVLCASRPLWTKAGELGIPESKRQVVYMGVDTQIFHKIENKSTVQKKIGIPDGLFVLSLRAIQPIYRPMDLAQVIPRVIQRVPNAIFGIFTYHADPQILSDFQQKINAGNANQSVIYIPPLNEDNLIASYFQAADIAVSIPFSDGMPASVLEAMACGCLLIASDLPNLQEWVRHENEGLLVPVGNLELLEDSLVRALTDAALRERLQKNAVQMINQQGDRKITLRQAQDIYAQFI